MSYKKSSVSVRIDFISCTAPHQLRRLGGCLPKLVNRPISAEMLPARLFADNESPSLRRTTIEVGEWE